MLDYSCSIVSSRLMLHFPLIYVCGSILSVQILKTIWICRHCMLASSCILVVISITEQSTNHVAPQTVYHKLEHALITDSKARESAQDTFFPTQELSRDLIFIHVNVTVGCILPSSCGRHSPSPGTPSNFSSVDQFSLI